MRRWNVPSSGFGMLLLGVWLIVYGAAAKKDCPDSCGPDSREAGRGLTAALEYPPRGVPASYSSRSARLRRTYIGPRGRQHPFAATVAWD